MNGIELRPDGPHSDDYTIEVARAVAESVRVLNYATGSHAARGLRYPQTVYTVTGTLSAAAGGLGQLLDQMGAFLRAQVESGRVADDFGTPETVLAVAETCLADARLAAAALARALADAQNATSGMYLPDPDESTDDTEMGAL
jgi:hypothetical protein